MKMIAGIAFVVVAAVLWSILSPPSVTPYDWQLPDEIPRPNVPDDNPMSDAKVQLGRWLFYDKRLSVNQTQSCGSCHMQALAFTDGEAHATGATGEHHPRGSMSLVNVAYASRLNWANPLRDRLEYQALTPLLGDNPIEMGMSGREDEIEALIEMNATYRELAETAFPGDSRPYSVLNAVRAIAAFVRSIVSFDSPYDQYLAGNSDAIAEAAENGMELFFSERLECFHCHGGFNFTDSTTHANTDVDRGAFHNNGLYNVGGSGDYPDINTGLYDMTGEERDMGRFKAPSLRNILLTAPYMHDGSLATIEDVIDHYARGGRLIEDGEQAGDGRLSPFKSEFVDGFELSDAERSDLIEFLSTLTDPSILTNERWADPFEP